MVPVLLTYDETGRGCRSSAEAPNVTIIRLLLTPRRMGYMKGGQATTVP